MEESKEPKIEPSSTLATEAPTSTSGGAQDSESQASAAGTTVPTVAPRTVRADVAAFLLWAFNETDPDRHAEWMHQADIDGFYSLLEFGDMEMEENSPLSGRGGLQAIHGDHSWDYHLLLLDQRHYSTLGYSQLVDYRDHLGTHGKRGAATTTRCNQTDSEDTSEASKSLAQHHPCSGNSRAPQLHLTFRLTHHLCYFICFCYKNQRRKRPG